MTPNRYYLNQDLTARAGMHFSGDDEVYLFSTTTDFIAMVDSTSFEVLVQVAQGKSVSEIAHALDFSGEESKAFFDGLEEDKLITSRPTSARLFEQAPDTDVRPLEQTIIVLTDKCNLACPFCYRASNPHQDNTITPESAFSLIPILNRHGLVELTLSGGEPLVVPYFKEIYQEARRQPFRINLQTNLTLFHKWLSFFQTTGFPSSITTSCDVYKGDGHEFDRISQNLRQCVGSGMRVAVNMMIQPRAIDKAAFAALFHELHDMGIPLISIGSPMPINQHDKNLFFESLEWATFIVNLQREVEKSNDELAPRNAVGVDPHLVCGAGDYLCVIQNGLFLLPCAAMPQYGIRLESPSAFSSVWSSPRTFESFRNPRALLNECISCDSFLKCQGGCKARALYSLGALDLPDVWNCAVFGKPTTVGDGCLFDRPLENSEA